jgi:hypothetical protein
MSFEVGKKAIDFLVVTPAPPNLNWILRRRALMNLRLLKQIVAYAAV